MHTKNTPPAALSTGEPKTGSRWGQDRRLEFIDFRLQWDGRLNRSDVTDFFGISVPQASLDIARYVELRPENMEYDRSSRVYLATRTFMPVFPVCHPSRYLNELLATATGVLPRDATFVGWWPSVVISPVPTRVLDVQVLVALLRAIREGGGLRIVYQSMSCTEPTSRAVTPHALAYDDFRWHVRAYCHVRRRFLDFVIGRILQVEGDAPAGPGGDEDAEWHTTVNLTLVPNPLLTEAKRRVVELDYGMDNGQLELSCRQALLFYTLKRLGLDSAAVPEPAAQQITLKNRDEVETFRRERISE